MPSEKSSCWAQKLHISSLKHQEGAQVRNEGPYSLTGKDVFSPQLPKHWPWCRRHRFHPCFCFGVCKNCRYALILLLVDAWGIIISVTTFAICWYILGVGIRRWVSHLLCGCLSLCLGQGILKTKWDHSDRRIWVRKYHYNTHLRLQTLKEASHSCKTKTPASKE